MRGIDHPSIVKLHTFSESAEYYFLILERQYSFSQSNVSLNLSNTSDGGWGIVSPDCQTDIF